jgi:fucose permease
MPIITGIVADWQGLAPALVVPAASYIWIIFYGVYRGGPLLHPIEDL